MYNLRPIIVSGPSGSGKDTIIKELIKRNPFIHDAVGYTTRMPRKGETSGKDINFTTEEEFAKMIENNQFIEYAKFAGNYYGMPFSEVEMSSKRLTIFNVGVSAASVIKSSSSSSTTILVLPPSKEELLVRLGERGIERFKCAIEDVKLASTFFDYLVISRTNLVDCAVDDVEKIIFNTSEELLLKNCFDFVKHFFD